MIVLFPVKMFPKLESDDGNPTAAAAVPSSWIFHKSSIFQTCTRQK